jgi:carbonic anhydrase
LRNVASRSVAAAIARGAPSLHGWVYDIGVGTLERYDDHGRSFVAVSR